MVTRRAGRDKRKTTRRLGTQREQGYRKTGPGVPGETVGRLGEDYEEDYAPRSGAPGG